MKFQVLSLRKSEIGGVSCSLFGEFLCSGIGGVLFLQTGVFWGAKIGGFWLVFKSGSRLGHFTLYHLYIR